MAVVIAAKAAALGAALRLEAPHRDAHLAGLGGFAERVGATRSVGTEAIR
jgi:hypothetical protein